MNKVCDTTNYFTNDPPSGDSIVDFSDLVIEYTQTQLSDDLEKQVDRVGTIALALDYGVWAVVGVLQGVTYLNHLLDLALNQHPAYSFVFTALKVISLPLTFFFFGMGIIEAVVQFVYVKRSIFLLNKVRGKTTSLDKVLWLNRKYFTLKDKETQKIQNFIESRYPQLSREEKEQHYDRIASKILKRKMESLERRITPGLAQEVANQLPSLIKEIASTDPDTRKAARQKTEHLMNSVTKQAKNKIIVHILALVSIALTLTSITALLVGVSYGTFFAVMGTVATIVMLASFAFKQGIVAKEPSKLYNRIAKLLPKEGLTTPFPNSLVAP